MSDGNERFESRARALFDQGVEGIDAGTRARLTRARHRALAELGRPAAWHRAWVPAGALAAAAVLAVALWTQPDSGGDRAVTGTAAIASLEDFEVLAAGDDLELMDEDFEFYAWAAQAGSANGIG